MRQSKVLAVVLAAAAVSGAARANDSCSGSYAAGLLGPLPAPLVVGLQVMDDSPRNVALAARFVSGLRTAGVPVDGAPTARLRVSADFSGGADPGANPSRDPTGTGFSWGGDVSRSAPGETAFGAAPAPGPQSLMLRAELRGGQDDAVIWVVTLQCDVQTNDTGQLAFDLGTVLGPVIGHRSERTPF